MKRHFRSLVLVASVPLAAAFLLGCPKKVEQVEPTPAPVVRESVMKTPSTSPGGGDSAEDAAAAAARAAARQEEEQRMAQLLASRGEDIPIKDAPAIEFRVPSPAEKLILTNVYFDYDKSTIKPEFRTALDGIAKWLNQAPEKQLLIEGHCDERGTDEYNLALGERRSLAVRRYLVGLGIAPDRLHTISYGEEKPADPGHDEGAWKKNRRAEFQVSAQ